MLLKITKIIHRSHCEATVLSAHERKRPTTVLLFVSLGPWPKNQWPGRRSSPAPPPAWAETGPTTRDRPSRRTAIRASRGIKTRRASPPGTLAPHFFLLPRSLSRNNGGGGWSARGRRAHRRRRGRAPPVQDRAPLPFLSFSSPHLSLVITSTSREFQPWWPGEDGVSATAGPLAGARVHPSVSAPPSSGSVVVPAALSLALTMWRRSGEPLVHCLSTRSSPR